MGFEFGNFSPEIQAKINNALEDGRISAEELRNMHLEKKDSTSIMQILLEHRNYVGDGFQIVTDKENGISLISQTSFDTDKIDVMLDDISLNTYKIHFKNNNIAKAKWENGVLYFLDAKGEIVKDDTELPLTANFNVTRYKDGKAETIGTSNSSTSSTKPVPYMGEVITPDMKFSDNGVYILPENPADTPYAITNNILIARYNKAYQDLVESYNDSGWPAEIASSVRSAFGSNADIKTIQSELDKMRAQITELKIALHTGESNYLEQFEKIFKAPFNENKIAELVSVENRLIMVQNDLEMKNNFDKNFSFILSHETPNEKFAITDENGKTYENTIDKEVVFQREFKRLAEFMDKISKGIVQEKITGEELLNQLFEYNHATTTEEKYKVMHDFVKDYSTMLEKAVKASCGDKSLEKLQEISNNLYKNTFGDSGDIQQKISDYIMMREKDAGIVKSASTIALTLFISTLTAGSGTGAALALLKGGAIFAGVNTAVEISDSATKLKNLNANNLGEYIKNVGQDVNWGEVMQANLIGGAMSVVFAGQSYLISNLTKICGEAIGAGAKTIATTVGVLDTAGVMATGTAMEYIMSGEVTIEGTAFNILFTVINGIAHVKQIKLAKELDNKYYTMQPHELFTELHQPGKTQEEIATIKNTLKSRGFTVSAKPNSNGQPEFIVYEPNGRLYEGRRLVEAVVTENPQDGYDVTIGGEKQHAKTPEEVKRILDAHKEEFDHINMDVELPEHATNTVSLKQKSINRVEDSSDSNINNLLTYLRNKKIICRQVNDNVIAGETFANKSIEDLRILKDSGIKTIIDFREYDETYKIMCESIGLKYESCPLIHISDLSKQKLFSGTKNQIVSNEFVKNLKKLLDLVKEGNVYMGCHYGIDRTNFAIILEYLFNNSLTSRIPRILPSDIGSSRTLLNRNLDLIRKIVKRLSPEQKNYLGIDDNFENVLKLKIREIVIANKEVLSSNVAQLIYEKLNSE